MCGQLGRAARLLLGQQSPAAYLCLPLIWLSLHHPLILSACRWAWCLPCGFDSIIPYFYVIYFGVLLGERLPCTLGDYLGAMLKASSCCSASRAER